MVAPRFIPSRLYNIEEIEDYQPGGYHPISIGDTFDQGRYRILHKLGFGGSSTVWLVRDQREGKDRGRIATLKAMRADISSQSPGEIPELAISQTLIQSLPPSHSADFQPVDHHFLVQGPNGSHRFLIYPLAGPSILAMSDSPGRVAGSRRLRADLARKVAKQTATTLHHMHSASVVHGDLTTSNILFRLSPHVIGWSDAEVYARLGDPETEKVVTRDGKPPGPHAPAMLVAPIQNDIISHASLLQESIIISDFGQSYIAACPPPSYEPGTMLSYQPPEARFEGRAGFEADIWTLGCVIFEIRAGFSLFESFLGSDIEVLKQTVETLGRLPDPWWGAFEQRALWFGEDGQPMSEQDQDRAGVLLKAYRTSIRMKLLEIGKQDDPPPEDDGPMIENSGVRLPDEEVDLLAGLLQKVLKYSPEERICIQDVIRHPWFTL
ncbi:kinase-like domain-containing protein [Russula dissimulans]|nr:kinase-like domain-containing protein [Russula dissimulans]